MPRTPDLNDIDLKKNPEYLEFLWSERRRTGIGSNALWKIIQNPPESLSISRIDNLFSGLLRYLPKDEYRCIVEAYSCIASNERIELTPQIVHDLKTQMKKKKLGPAAISKQVPKRFKFNAGVLQSWLRQQTKTARKDLFGHIKEITDHYEPPRKKRKEETKEPYVSITDEFLEKLESEIVRTNVAPSKMLKLTGEKRIQFGAINDWRKRKISKAIQGNLEIAIAGYAKLPTLRK